MGTTARVFAALLAALALAGCGGGESSGVHAAGPPGAASDAATLWVTSDGGARVVLTAQVPVGDSVLQALDRKADVKTRYGGRFVQGVDGIEGSITKHRDWFFFVNGIEPGQGAAEVELGRGDIAWWDYRDWAKRMEAPVVVGAFPEPFVHGWNGKRRPVRVEAPAGLGEQAAALRRLLAPGGGAGEPNVFRLVVEDGTRGATLAAKRGPSESSPVTFTLAGSQAAVAAAAAELASDPAVVRYRYEARFDERGKVVP